MTEIDRYGYEVERVSPERPDPPPPFTPEDLKALVDVVVAYNRVQPDKSLIQVWAAQSQMGRWTYDEAVRAVHLWGRDRQKGDFIEPADITRLIRAERQDRAMRAEAARLTANPGDPATAARIAQVVADVANTLGWDDNREPGGTALSVRCPHCGVPARQRCTASSTGKALTKSACHPSRLDAQADLLRGEAS